MSFLPFIVCFVISLLITPLVKRFAFMIGAVDRPEQRKMHQVLMPRLGGAAIYISFLAGIFLVHPQNMYSTSIVAATIIIVITGICDDIYELSPGIKLLGQLAATCIVVFYGGLKITFINLPFDGLLQFGMLSVPFTFLWIIGITNAINLIDGLDGLAAGVSSIVLITISGMAIIMGNIYVVAVGSILLSSTLGFLIYNFHPAKIFMGDTGAMFLGFMISVLSLLGFKNVTVVSFIFPIIVLGVPISDTFYAILRRIINKKPLSSPDKSHLHHCIIRMGYTHRQTVLIIYALSALFGLAAVIFTQARFWEGIILIGILIFLIEIFAEAVGLIGKEYRPLLKVIRIFHLSTDKNR